MDDFILSQYFKSPPIQYPNPICSLVSLPDEVDDARDSMKELPSVIFKMAAYQMKILRMAERSGVPIIDHILYWRRHEGMLRDKLGDALGDAVPMLNRVDRALCIYALDSLIRWERERHPE
jgi:hypothetical protein